MLMQEMGKDWDDKGVLGNTYEKHHRMKELWTELLLSREASDPEDGCT